MRKFLLAPLLVAVFSAALIGAPAAASAAARNADPTVLAIVPAPASATCSYRLDTNHNGVTTRGQVLPCPANALQHSIKVSESVAKSHQWSYIPVPTRAGLAHPSSTMQGTPASLAPSTVTSQAHANSCPVAMTTQKVSPNCGGGGGGGSPCNYFQNLWTWANFGDGASFSANVAYTVNCGALQLNWSQIGQFGWYGNHYTLGFVDYNWVNIGGFWQGIPQGHYSFQSYGRWTSLGGDFVFATYNSNNWADWDWINMGNLW